MESVLYAVPNIHGTVYVDGLDATDALALAIKNYNKNKNTDNLNIVKDKMALLVLWLTIFSKLVVKIANDEANCTTREEASTNIGLSGFEPHKLSQAKKGNPDDPIITAYYAGDGIIEIKVVNGKSFDASSITVIAVEVPPVKDPVTPLPKISIEDNQVTVTSKVAVKVVTKTISGKERIMKLNKMNTHAAFNVCIFCQNGNQQISKLSNVVLVEIMKMIE